jgi:hypothetical protein
MVRESFSVIRSFAAGALGMAPRGFCALLLGHVEEKAGVSCWTRGQLVLI